jgi:hypothetical protein
MRDKVRAQDGPVWYLVAKDEGRGYGKRSALTKNGIK